MPTTRTIVSSKEDPVRLERLFADDINESNKDPPCEPFAKN